MSENLTVGVDNRDSMSAYVVGIDGSGPSEAALRWATSRAAAQSAPVRLVHVIEDEWGLAGGDFAKEAMFAGEAVLQRALEQARSTSPEATARILHGSPVWELTNDCRADELLVVGTHKTGFLHGRVLGSRSVTVAALAPCSVMVVPTGQSAARRGVVAGVVWAEGPQLGVASAAREAARLDEPLTLVHASPAREGLAADSEHARERQRELLRRASEIAQTLAPHVSVHTRVSSRRPADALLEASYNATMLVLEPSRDGTRDVVGSTTHDVLMNINAPVLVSRNDAV